MCRVRSYDAGPMEELAAPVPRYSQIAQRLRNAIVTGEHPPGQTIPSESQLADSYRVSRAVVRQAIALLEAEGLLTVAHGRGTYVREHPPLFHRGRLQVERRGVRPGQSAFEVSVRSVRRDAKTKRELIAVEKVPAPAEAAARLLLPEEDEKVWVRRRLFWVDGEPVEVQDGYFPVAVAEGTLLAEKRSTPSGLQAFFEDDLHLTIDKIAEDVQSRMPTPEEKQQLELPPGVPLLEVWRTRSAVDIGPVEASRCLFRSDRWRLRYEMDGALVE
jgi:GntR family transcriptional regulator